MGKIVGNVSFGLVGLACIGLGIADAGARAAILVGLLFVVVAAMNLRTLLNLQGGRTGPHSILDLDFKVRDVGTQLVEEVPKDWTEFKFFIERNGTRAYTCRVEGPGGASMRPSYAVQRHVTELSTIIYARNQHTRLLCTAKKLEGGEWKVHMEPEDRV